MFSGCSSLIQAPNVPSSVEFAGEMFDDCSKLSGTMDIMGRLSADMERQ